MLTTILLVVFFGLLFGVPTYLAMKDPRNRKGHPEAYDDTDEWTFP